MKIINAGDYAKRRGGKNGRDWIRIIQAEKKRKGIIVGVLNIDNPIGEVVFARVENGQWIADCGKCGGAEAVDSSFPAFFCWSCGNYENGGKCRPVVFPENIQEIESLLLERPVKVMYGLDEIERTINAQPEIGIDVNGNILPLGMNWLPHETVKDLKKQNEPIKKFKRGE